MRYVKKDENGNIVSVAVTQLEGYELADEEYTITSFGTITPEGYLNTQAYKEQLEKFEKRREAIKEIVDLKQQLADTDYQAIKFAEGELTEEDFAPIKAQRKVWREKINELESLLS